MDLGKSRTRSIRQVETDRLRRTGANTTRSDETIRSRSGRLKLCNWHRSHAKGRQEYSSPSGLFLKNYERRAEELRCLQSRAPRSAGNVQTLESLFAWRSASSKSPHGSRQSVVLEESRRSQQKSGAMA